MLISMTGYGRRECDLENSIYSIEIKSLNSKQLDISIKLPVLLKDKEIEMRNMISSKLQRGKIELGIFHELKEGSGNFTINRPVVQNYIRQLRDIAKGSELDDTEQILQVAMRLPESMQSQKEELDEGAWQKVRQGITDALAELITFRKQEGSALEKDISFRVHSIMAKLAQIEPYESERISRIRKRILVGLEEIMKNVEADNNRLEQEMIFYFEKMDITEEKVRLKNHCRYFIETMHEEGPLGKKLGFISQEMGREINTLGSKASDSDIQKLVVEMKDELEKVKEQILNVL